MLYFWYNLYCLNTVSYVLTRCRIKARDLFGIFFFFLILCHILGLNFLQKEVIIKKGLNEITIWWGSNDVSNLAKNDICRMWCLFKIITTPKPNPTPVQCVCVCECRAKFNRSILFLTMHQRCRSFVPDDGIVMTQCHYGRIRGLQGH